MRPLRSVLQTLFLSLLTAGVARSEGVPLPAPAPGPVRLAAAEGTAGARKAPFKPDRVDSGCPVHPQAVSGNEVMAGLVRGANQLRQKEGLTPQKELIAQLERRECTRTLAAGGGPALDPEVRYRQARESVMVVGLFGEPPSGITMAAGFMVTADGVMVTNYHVVNDPKLVSMVAMGPDGIVYPVREVLAANEEQDIALLQLGGTSFPPPLPLASQADIGSSVSVIGHPNFSFYTLTTGIVTQHPVIESNNGRTAQLMCVSAEFAIGSSGGPVLNPAGEAVGMVLHTNTITGSDNEGGRQLQMVLRFCSPAAAIQRLIQPAAAPPSAVP